MAEPVIEREGGTGNQSGEGDGGDAADPEWTDPAGEPVTSEDPSAGAMSSQTAPGSEGASTPGTPPVSTADTRPREVQERRDRDVDDLATGHAPGDDSQTGERTYECLGCHETGDHFVRRCPNCGGSEFRTDGDAGDSAGVVDRTIGWIARVTAPVNPYIPR